MLGNAAGSALVEQVVEIHQAAVAEAHDPMPTPWSEPATIERAAAHGTTESRPGSDASIPTRPAADRSERAGACTAPQLRRFIKSRPYVPMHELRRRFGIDGQDDDVTQIDIDGRRLYVGLPQPEGSLLGELLRSGDVGYELSHDPTSPIVVGVFAMRPVPRT